MELLPLEEVYVLDIKDEQRYKRELFCIRAKFLRGEKIKFISHLDIMRTFGRALRRSDIPISYTHGFNPQTQIVFGLPLAVGFTSQSEYADFQLARYVKPDTFVHNLNKELPSGLEILNAKIRNSSDNIMSSISTASYTILVYTPLYLGINENDMKEKICAFQNRMNIMIEKESKKRIRNIDIRPMIYNLGIEVVDTEYSLAMDLANGQGKTYVIKALLSAGGRANLRPELLISALNLYVKMDFSVKKIHRTGLFIEKEGRIIDPLDDQVLK